MQLKDVSGRAQTRAEELLRKLQSLPVGVSYPGFVRDSQLARGLMTDKGFPSQLGLVAQHTAHAIHVVLEQVCVAQLYDTLVFCSLTDGRAEFEYNPHLQRNCYGLQLLSSTEIDGGCLWGTEVLLGNKRLVRELPDYEVRGWEALKWMLQTPQLAEPWESPELDNGDSVPVLSTDELVQCAQAALSLTTAVNNFRQAFSSLGTLAGQLREAAQGTLGNDTHPNGNPTGELALQQKWQRDYLAQAPRWLLLEPSRVSTYALGKATLLLNYIDKCLTFYLPEPSRNSHATTHDHRAATACSYSRAGELQRTGPASPAADDRRAGGRMPAGGRSR